MKNTQEKLLTSSRVAMQLDVSVKTLTNWYKWYYDNSIEKPKKFPKLPEYIQERANGPRYWTQDDVKQLKKFKKWIPKGRSGVMGDISCKYIRNRKEKEENDE